MISLRNVLRRVLLLAVVFPCCLGPATLRAQDDLTALEEQAIKRAVAKAADSVVRIETFGGLERVGRVLVGTGPTTGLVVSEDGYVVSSAFNFIQLPSSILVTLPSGKRAAAEIVSRDSNRMLVLLKVNTDEKLVVPEAVPKQEMAVGQWAIAMGRTFDSDSPNVSVGILSALSRIWGKAIQTDAKVSPSNYGGPLIDIRGRVLGVLVPLSPRGGSEVAGAEWYDSGIGFAIPLCEIIPHLEKMKRGEELKPGLLGLSLKGKDIYADPAEVAACQPKSPAYEAGLKAGDRIVEVNGMKIVRQAQLKHALGPRYAGESVHLVYLRGQQRLEATVELTDKLEPYEHPFLGVLPLRSGDSEGVIVRFVYEGSPAAEAGIAAGNVLLELADEPVASVAGAWEILANFEPGATLPVLVRQGDAEKHLDIELAALPAEIPDQLPPPRQPLAAPDPPLAIAGEIEVKIPEDPHKCLAYVPESYRPEVSYGLLIWLHEPGKFDRAKAIQRWKNLCDDNDLILLAPQADNPSRWLATEVAFIRKAIDEVVSKYNIDPARIVAHGYQAGGAMAYLTALKHRDIIRAVSAVDATLPARTAVMPNDPIARLAFYTTYAKESKLAARIKATSQALQRMKYPVILRELEGETRDLNSEELAELVRWIDTLDRI